VAVVEQDPRVPERRRALRTATLHLVIGVATVHAVAFALFYLLHIEAGPERTRTIFIAVWTFATAITVAFLLRRVRMARMITRTPMRRP
jgi:heme/copper-type cytochrome/quinol oxidase subunit 4